MADPLPEPPAPQAVTQAALTPAECPDRAERARRNGARSRGPRSEAGKARSSRNALRHGLCAKVHVVLEPEDDAAFAGLSGRLLAELAPGTALGGFLAARLAAAMWQTGRAERLEAQAFDHRAVPDPDRLNLALRYRGSVSRELLRTLRELRQLQRQPPDAAVPRTSPNPDLAPVSPWAVAWSQSEQAERDDPSASIAALAEIAWGGPRPAPVPAGFLRLLPVPGRAPLDWVYCQNKAFPGAEPLLVYADGTVRSPDGALLPDIWSPPPQPGRWAAAARTPPTPPAPTLAQGGTASPRFDPHRHHLRVPLTGAGSGDAGDDPGPPPAPAPISRHGHLAGLDLEPAPAPLPRRTDLAGHDLSAGLRPAAEPDPAHPVIVPTDRRAAATALAAPSEPERDAHDQGSPGRDAAGPPAAPPDTPPNTDSEPNTYSEPNADTEPRTDAGPAAERERPAADPATLLCAPPIPSTLTGAADLAAPAGPTPAAPAAAVRYRPPEQRFVGLRRPARPAPRPATGPAMAASQGILAPQPAADGPVAAAPTSLAAPADVSPADPSLADPGAARAAHDAWARLWNIPVPASGSAERDRCAAVTQRRNEPRMPGADGPLGPTEQTRPHPREAPTGPPGAAGKSRHGYD